MFALGVLMQLDDQQKKIVKGWIEEGLDLSEIQGKLESDFNISMTYMDVRFLVGDLKLVPKDLEEPVEDTKIDEPNEAEQMEATPDNPFPAPDDPLGGDSQTAENNDQNDDTPSEAGNVSISVSSITKPGMMASGSVTFSDGKTCDWYVDQFGRPGLVPPSEGYQPPEADMPIFGQKLQQALQGGY